MDFFYGFIHEATIHESYNPSFSQDSVQPAFKTVASVALASGYFSG